MKKWIVLIVLVALVIGMNIVYNKESSQETTQPDQETNQKADQKKETPNKQKKPSMVSKITPGKVVDLQTTRGTISFVLYEKDVPMTASRIAYLVKEKAYDGVAFPRVENWVIQTDTAKKDIYPMGIEPIPGINHVLGAVGMARTSDPNSNISTFYILLKPAKHLDTKYTVFGMVIKGLDIASKIKKGDIIKKASLRPITPQERADFEKLNKK